MSDRDQTRAVLRANSLNHALQQRGIFSYYYVVQWVDHEWIVVRVFKDEDEEEQCT